MRPFSESAAAVGVYPRSADIEKLLLGLHQCVSGRLRLICRNKDRWLENRRLCPVHLPTRAHGPALASESHCSALVTLLRWLLNTGPAAAVCLLLLPSRSLRSGKSLPSASRALQLCTGWRSLQLLLVKLPGGFV